MHIYALSSKKIRLMVSISLICRLNLKSVAMILVSETLLSVKTVTVWPFFFFPAAHLNSYFQR